MDVILEVTKDALRNVAYFIKNNLINFANILNFILPFGMYFIGLGSESFQAEYLLIPIFFTVFMYYIKSIANKLGKGITIPIPDERFTEVDDDGEVSIRHDRVQELLLYTADLEDWLERKGLL